MDRSRPRGRVIGIDLIPAEPPKGVATFQGDFLSPNVQKMVKDFISQSVQTPLKRQGVKTTTESSSTVELGQPSYIDVGLHAPVAGAHHNEAQVVDVSLLTKIKSWHSKPTTLQIVLSDMSAPWEQTSGFNVNSLSNPYHRLMNTSGVAFRDHAGSMVSAVSMLLPCYIPW